MSAYLFIDGNYLRKAYEHTMASFFGQTPPALNYRKLAQIGGQSYNRLFYYDAVDYEPHNGETKAQTDARVSERRNLHRRINSIPNFHVREGFVSTGRQVGRRRQKAVDVQLAVDALEQAALRNMSHAGLLLGDLDFQPLIVALIRFGVRVTVFYEHGETEELLQVADERYPLTLLDYRQLAPSGFASEGRAFPSFGNPANSSYPNVMRRGTWNGRRAVLASHGNETHIAPPYELFVQDGDDSRGQNVSVYYDGADVSKLELAFTLAYGGSFVWQ
jgi:uncharacterized LabA/DUF88 family protein